MDKVLIPIDFSSASSYGFYYAYEMAKELNLELCVAHLYWPFNGQEIDKSATIVKKMTEEIKMESLHHLKAATQVPLGDASEVKISHVVASGMETTIYEVAKEENADLIIMGTHGAGNAIKKMWGSNAEDVIQNAHCPVMVIPDGVVYSPIKNIAYATDFDTKELDTIFQLSVVAAASDANLHCVHIDTVNEKYGEKKEEDYKKKFDKNFSAIPITYSVWSAQTVEDGLEVFCRINKIDVLAMMPQDKSFWDKIFGKKSMTKSMLNRTKIPLLSFHE